MDLNAHKAWKHTKKVPFSLIGSNINSYKHESGVSLHIADVSGPICSCLIVVPTEADNHKGLPHTLEHLVFLGCKKVPHRGYLDVFATRCLANGTNAYTADDHTCYSVSCAGFEGMLLILPIFLDYILHPTLTDSNFVTEIYHVDGEGREMGVVYCEMSGRENTEDDLREMKINQLLFPNSGYAYSTGGLTPHIAQLTNEMIKEYHARYYQPQNVSIILQGQLNVNDVLKSLSSVDFSPNVKIAPQPRSWSSPIPDFLQTVSETVSFPTEDESVGSLSFAWRGPSTNDVFTITALQILFRYLEETAASPLQRRFVERPSPLASSASFTISTLKSSKISLDFTGVPTKRLKGSSNSVDSEEEDDMSVGSSSENEEGSSGSEGVETEDDEDGNLSDDEWNANLLAPNSMFTRVRDELAKIVEKGNFDNDPQALPRAVRRHRVKWLESLEDNPKECITDSILPDIVFPWADTSKTDGAPDNTRFFGRWINVMDIIQKLETKEDGFWIGLIERWLLNAPHVEVIMKPDKQLAKRMSEDNQARLASRIKEMGPEGLKVKRELLEHSLSINSQPLPDKFSHKSFPPIPSGDKIPLLAATSQMNTKTLFPIQVVQLATQFNHAKLVFHIRDIPDDLRPYLVLFQELILETDIEKNPAKAGGPRVTIPYSDAVRALNEQVVSIECGVGLGNETFSCECLPELFYIYAVSETEKYETMCQWIVDLVFNARFPEQRIQAMVTNLLSDAREELRDGSNVASVMSTMVLERDLWEKNKSNHMAISILVQSQFLKSLKKDLENGQVDKIAANLARVQKYLWADNSRIIGQICTAAAAADPCDKLLQAWNTTIAYAKADVSAVHAHKKPKQQIPKNELLLGSNFALPFVRQVGRGMGRPVSLITPIGGVESAFLYQMVDCCVNKQDEDFLPMLVLNEIISLTEGPLYTRIRGKGYAYDAKINFHMWSSSLYFNLYECSAPARALEEFYGILREIADAGPLLDDFMIDTAKSSLLYHFHSTKSNPPSIISTSLRAVFKGFKSLDEEIKFESRLSSVNRQSIMAVYRKYYTAFLDPVKMIVITCNPSSVDEIKLGFAKEPINCNLEVKEVNAMTSPF